MEIKNGRLFVNRILKSLIRRGFINNKFVNPVLLLFGMDSVLNDRSQDYVSFTPDEGRSLQEIAGYSHTPEINEVLSRIRTLLTKSMGDNVPEQGKILDVGCGPGFFLKEFNGKYQLYGIDISYEMCRIARKNVAEAVIINSHFLNYNFEIKMDAIYSIGVLIYFSKTQVIKFFEKIHELLNPGGIAFISYPHAFRSKDLTYHDYTYVHYSPVYLERVVEEKFHIVLHSHQDQTRKVIDYDRTPFQATGNYDKRSYVNSSILVIKKK